MADITIVANKSALPATETYDNTNFERLEPSVNWISFSGGNVIVLKSAPVGDFAFTIVKEAAGVFSYDYLFVTVNNDYTSTTESDVVVQVAPQNYGLRKQAIKLKLNSNGGQYTTRGIKARRVLVLESVPAASSTLTLTRNGVGLTFTFVNDSVLSPGIRDIKRNNTSLLSTHNWLKLVVVPKLLQFKHLSDFYNIYVGGNAIFFEAKNYGSESNLTPSFNAAFAYVGDLSNVNPVLKPNYKLYVRVAMSEQSNSLAFNEVVEFEGTPDDNNECEFYLQRALEFRSQLNYPDNGAFIGNEPNMQAMRPYVYMWGSKYGVPVQHYPAGISNTTRPPYVLDGGINHFDENPLLIDKHLINGKASFLTNMPEHVVVHPKMPLILSWIVSETNIYIRQADVDENGNIGSASTFIADSRNPYLHNFIRTTDTFLSTSYPTPLIEGMARRYWINTDSEEETGLEELPRKYLTAHLAEFWAYDDNRFFWFKNSYGVFELMWVHGLAKHNIETERETLEKYYAGGYTTYAERRVLEDRDTWYKEEVDLSTGVIDTNEQADFNAYKQWIVEFLNSEDVYEIIGGKFYPIVITSKNYNLGSVWDNVLNVPFKYRYAYDNGGVLNQYVPPVYAPVELPGGETPGGGDPGGEGGVVNVKRADGTLISAVTAPADFTVNNTAVTLRDSAGNLLSTTSVKPAFTDTNITAPDGEAQLVNTVASPIGDVAIKAGEAKEVVVPDTEITVKNSLGLSIENVEVPSCQPNEILIGDSNVIIKNTEDDILYDVEVAASASGLKVINDSTVEVKDSAGDLIVTKTVAAEKTADTTIADSTVQITNTFDEVIATVNVKANGSTTQPIDDSNLTLNGAAWTDVPAKTNKDFALVDENGATIPGVGTSTQIEVPINYNEYEIYFIRQSLINTGNY